VAATSSRVPSLREFFHASEAPNYVSAGMVGIPTDVVHRAGALVSCGGNDTRECREEVIAHGSNRRHFPAEGSLSGSLVPGGNVRGSLTLSNASGEVRLSLNGTIPRSTRAPAQARFQILSGTGAYAGSTGTGTARIRLQAISVNASTGSFSLQLSPSASRR
jgi:hypothetical protein